MYKPVFVKKTANTLSVKEFHFSSCFSVSNDQVTTEMQSQCRHVPQSIKFVSTASLPKVIFLNKAFCEVSSYSTIHPKHTSAYLILDCTNSRTVVIYTPRAHIIHIYISASTDTYLHIQEAPVPYTWNSQSLLCTLRSAVCSGAQPLNIWLKEVIICPVRTTRNVLQHHTRTFKSHLTLMTSEFECHHTSLTGIWQYHTHVL